MSEKSQILIVDDTPASLKLLSDLLKNEGFDVRPALSGELALEAVRSQTPDLILLDIMMPVIDGFTVCRRLKADPHTCHIPVLFISAISEPQEILQGFELGAVDYVTKPFRREELLARVRTHLEISRLRHHLEDVVKERNRQLLASEQQLKTTLNDYMIAHAQLHTLLHTIPDLIWLKDPNGVYLACNRRFESLYGAKEADIVGKTDYDFVDKKLADSFRCHDLRATATGRVCANEEYLSFADGSHHGLFETLKTPMYDKAGGLIGVLGIARDISERKNAEARIHRQMQLYALLSQCNKAILHCIREDELFSQICQIAAQLDGILSACIVLSDGEGGKLRAIACAGREARGLADLDALIAQDGGHPCKAAIQEQRALWSLAPNNTPQGDNAHQHAISALPLWRDGTVIGALLLQASMAMAFDESARNLLSEMVEEINFALENFSRERARLAAEAEIERLAFYDQLTHLPNRKLLYDRLQQAIATNARNGSFGAVLFIGLDDFKSLNDTRGHAVGDLLLAEVARRLQNSVREDDSVARPGGDQFVIVLNGVGDEVGRASAQVKVLADKILASIDGPYLLKGLQHHCSASVGISIFGNSSHSAGELLKHSETALYQAKRKGRNSLMFYDPAMQAALEARTGLENDLRLAIRENQFVLFYQMQVDHQNRIVGAEALLRWQHPQRGLVSPQDFIPLAEQTGLIVTLGQWVLERACQQLLRWDEDACLSRLTLAVNVSALQFHQTDFVERVGRTIQGLGRAADRLKLELTESLVLSDINDTIVKIQRLRETGVQFSIDDFGTGYSSLSYLTKLPIDQLKIDQSFVRNIGVTPNDTIVVQTIIGMAENLQLECVAEGVETQAQYEFLKQSGCRTYQGYWFAKPLPLADFERQATAKLNMNPA